MVLRGRGCGFIKRQPTQLYNENVWKESPPCQIQVLREKDKEDDKLLALNRLNFDLDGTEFNPSCDFPRSTTFLQEYYLRLNLGEYTFQRLFYYVGQFVFWFFFLLFWVTRDGEM